MWLEITLTKSGPTYYPAEGLLNEVYFTVGASTYDKHFPLWYRAYDEMYRSAEEKQAYRRLVDFAPEDPIGCRKKFYVPLLFTFNRFAGCALPIIGLEFHDLQMFVNLGQAPQGIDATQAPEVTMWIDYVFLSQDEREKFAKDQHEYLIDQVQYTGPENATMSTSSLKSQQVRLNLNHPVKALLWALGGASHGVYTAGPAGTHNDSYAPLKSSKLTLNGSDRYAVRDGAYFNQVQPFTERGRLPRIGHLHLQLRPEAARLPAHGHLQLLAHRERHHALHLEADLHPRHRRLRHPLPAVRPRRRGSPRRPQHRGLEPQRLPRRAGDGRDHICIVIPSILRTYGRCGNRRC